jgi:hypothetical protein
LAGQPGFDGWSRVMGLMIPDDESLMFVARRARGGPRFLSRCDARFSECRARGFLDDVGDTEARRLPAIAVDF